MRFFHLLARAIFFVLAIPFGLLLTLAHGLLGLTLRFTTHVESSVPENAIIFFTHPQIFFMAYCKAIRKDGEYPTYVLGFHGFIPYIWTVLDRMVGIIYILYDRFSLRSRGEQILTWLLEHPQHRISIATDSGGPYGKVRSSLLKLALSSNRPLVGFGARGNRTFKIKEHLIPLPGCHVEYFFLAPISVDKLRSLPHSEALAVLQAEFEQLRGYSNS